MKKSAITTAFKALIETLPIDATYPNVTPKVTRPYLEVTFAASDRTDDSLEGGVMLRETGRVSVVVVADEQTGAKTSEDTADSVAELFPTGLRIPITDGQITITQPANIRPGFQGGASDWRVPVIISYVADRDTP